MGIWPGKLHDVVEGICCKTSALYSRGVSMARRSSNSAAEIAKGVVCHSCGESRTALVKGKVSCEGELDVKSRVL